jgi:hypothetical protein
LFDDLADRAELGPYRFGLADQCRQHDVLFALRMDEIAAEDLGSRLELAVYSAVALFEPRRVPR